MHSSVKDSGRNARGFRELGCSRATPGVAGHLRAPSSEAAAPVVFPPSPIALHRLVAPPPDTSFVPVVVTSRADRSLQLLGDSQSCGPARLRRPRSLLFRRVPAPVQLELVWEASNPMGPVAIGWSSYAVGPSTPCGGWAMSAAAERIAHDGATDLRGAACGRRCAWRSVHRRRPRIWRACCARITGALV